MAKKETPLEKKALARLKSLGITGETTVEGATSKLLAKLKKMGYEGFDDDPLESIMEIAEAIDEPEEETPPAKKGGKKQAAQEPEEEEETTEEEEEATEPEEEEEEEEAPPVKRAVKKAVKPEPEEEEEEENDKLAKEVETKKPLKKPVVETKEKKEVKRASNSFDKENPEHMKLANKLFGKLFPKDKYAIGGISGGFAIRLLGDNVKIVLLKYSAVTIDNGHMIGNLNFKKIREVDELEKLIPDGFGGEEGKVVEKVATRGYVRINSITDKEIVELLSDEDVFNTMLDKGKKIDKKMGANRAKLQENLKGAGKKATPAAAPVKGKKVAEPEEEEEEEEAPPVKKAVKKAAPAPAAPTAKKPAAKK